MADVTCVVCSHQLRKDTANIDAKWESYRLNGEYKHICRDCAKMVAQSVLNEY